MRFSYSKLSTFTTCPQRYKFRYIDNIPDFSTAGMMLGSKVHETIHKLFKNQPIDSIDDSFVVNRAKRVVEEIIKKYTVVGSEVYFNLPVLDTEFEGYIDLITKDTAGNLYVLDFKLGSGSLLQTAIYAWMLEKAKNKKVNFIGLVKVSLNGDETINEDIKPFTDDYRQEVERFIKNTLEEMNKGEYTPKPSENCLRCSYVEFCPLKEYVLQKRLDELTVEQKLDLIFYIDAFKDSLNAQLKEALKSTDRIESTSAVAFMEESSYKKLSVKQLPDEVYTQLFDMYGFNGFEPKKELVQEHFPNLFKEVSQKRLKIIAKEG